MRCSALFSFLRPNTVGVENGIDIGVGRLEGIGAYTINIFI